MECCQDFGLSVKLDLAIHEHAVHVLHRLDAAVSSKLEVVISSQQPACYAFGSRHLTVQQLMATERQYHP